METNAEIIMLPTQKNALYVCDPSGHNKLFNDFSVLSTPREGCKNLSGHFFAREKKNHLVSTVIATKKVKKKPSQKIVISSSIIKSGHFLL